MKPLGKTLGTNSLFGFEMASIVSCLSSGHLKIHPKNCLMNTAAYQADQVIGRDVSKIIQDPRILLRSFTIFELIFPEHSGNSPLILSTWCVRCRSYLSLLGTQRCVWRRLWRYHQEWSPKRFDHIRSNKKERLERVSRVVLRSNIWYYYLIYLISGRDDFWRIWETALRLWQDARAFNPGSARPMGRVKTWSLFVSIVLARWFPPRCLGYLSICLSVYLSIYQSIYLSTYLSIYLSNYLPTYQTN
jgi:hypothetical protein